MSSKEDHDDRDDFSLATLRLLAGRSGYICAFPGCRRLTVGPSDDRKSGLSMVGVGAHITAASKHGPRYDNDLSREERSDVNNGVWMCQTHAKLVDDNASKHTVAELRRWKTQHENWVFHRIANGPAHPHAGVSVLRITNIGPFRECSEVKLGRVTVVVGDNCAGKSTVCETLAAFSGEPLFSHFAKRWRFGTAVGDVASIETAVVKGEDVTTVKLIERFHRFYLAPEDASEEQENGEAAGTQASEVVAHHFQIEVNGAISSSWPTSRYPTILRHEELRGAVNPSFEQALSNLARQFRLSDDVIWSSLRDDFFVSSGYACKFRRKGDRKIEIALPGRDYYLSPGNLSASEQWRVIRRFLMHVLPSGFHRIRHYGLFASGVRAHNIARACELLAASIQPNQTGGANDGDEAEPNAPSHPCPCCGGRMIVIETFERGRAPRGFSANEIRIDTS